MREYTKLWFKQSLSRSWTIGDSISGAVGILIGIVGHYSPQWKNEVSGDLWLIPIYALAATAFCRFFIFAPYELWKAEREKAIKHEDTLSAIGSQRPLRFDAIEFQFNTDGEDIDKLGKLRFSHTNMSDRLIQYELVNIICETVTTSIAIPVKVGKVFLGPYSSGIFDVELQPVIALEEIPAMVLVNFDYIYDTVPPVKERITGAKARYQLTSTKPGSTVNGPWYDEQREQ